MKLKSYVTKEEVEVSPLFAIGTNSVVAIVGETAKDINYCVVGNLGKLWLLPQKFSVEQSRRFL